ncbi:arylsulfatase [Opitutaceae bacterium]|nr:arylsulfatase [Opitutaceae bacterium]
MNKHPLKTACWRMAAALLVCGVANLAASQPNIIYILADDMGYGDIRSLNDEGGVPTPHMDRIVKEGIHFTDFHTNSSVCTPTRYGVLTGRYAWRSRMKTGVLWGYDEPLIEPDRVTVASHLQSSGYTTAVIGKWHLGLGWQQQDESRPIRKYEWNDVFQDGDDSNVDFSKKVTGGPSVLGFDYSYIIPSSLDMSPYVYLENDWVVELPTAFTPGKDQAVDGRGVFWRSGEVSPSFDFEDVLPNLTRSAVSYIEKQADGEKPFFLYFPLPAPHTPWLPTADTVGRSEGGTYGDFVVLVDDMVGQVLATLDRLGIAENTMIVVTADNGAHWTPEDKTHYAHRPNYIFRGQKADIYEGGHRVPYLARWPAKVPAGSASDQVMCTTDLLATVAGITGKPLPPGAGEDSVNMLPAHLEPELLRQLRGYTIHHSLNGHFAIRQGKWKLTERLGSGGFSTPQAPPEAGDPNVSSLFDMERDPGEKNDLREQYPEIVRSMSALLVEVSKEGRVNE